jgi:MFS family permease
VFSAIAAAGALLAVAVIRMPSGAPGPGAVHWRELRPALADRKLLGAMWLVALPALLAGTLAVIAPLRLAALGFGASAIGVTWLLAAASEASLNPRIGRLSDRVGRRRPLQAALVASACGSIAIPWISDRWLLASAVLLAAVAYGSLWVPAMTHLSHRADQAGLSTGVGLALQSTWAPAHVAGTILLGGAVAEWLGRPVAFLLLAAMCAITLCVAPVLVDHPTTQGGHTRWA